MSDTPSTIPAFVAAEIAKAIGPLQQRISKLERKVSELKLQRPKSILQRIAQAMRIAA